MIIKANEHSMLKRFHEKFFDVHKYRAKDKPDIDEFVIYDSCISDVQRKKLILALYTFNFWYLGYCIKRPSEERVNITFKKYD